MIKGAKKQDLSIKSILAKIGPYDIYRFYLGDFTLAKAMKSPFRKDKHPSFSVRMGQSGLYHIDYGDESFRGDCFKLVQQLWGLTFDQALEKIDKDFGLGITGGPTRNYQRIILQYDEPEMERKYVHILVITRKLNSEELAYWNQYHLSADDLKKNHVYGVEKVYMNRRLIPNYGKGLRFAYFSEPHWKIYKPTAKKGEKFYPNNIPNDMMEGLGNLMNCDIGIITKSRKDRMVISKIFPNVCSTQNESPAAINEDNLTFIQQNCKQPYIAFDNDKPGKKASQHYTNEYGWKHINVPDHYLPGITDFADLAKEHGLDRVVRHFQAKGILPKM
jgi:hypothetical protein